jgi:type I restriction enzyme M protein
LFLTTGIPVCLWFVTRDKSGKKLKPRGRDRRGETLFINARHMGTMETRTLRVLSGRDQYPLPTDSDIGQIARTYHAWRGETDAGEYQDVPGFCKSAKLQDVRNHGFVLTPALYTGTADIEDDGEPFEEKMQRLTVDLYGCLAEAESLGAQIKSNLEGLGYGG